MSEVSPTPKGLPAPLAGGAPRHRYPSDSTRSLRRRRQRETPQALFAHKLLELAGRAPDEQSRDGLHRVVHNLRLRFSRGDAGRRFSVLAAPPHVAVGGAATGGYSTEEQRRAADFAQELLFLMDKAPDEAADREINAVVKGILLRFSPDENRQRLAVLKALESSELLALAEIVALTGLGEECVSNILDDFTSDEVGLAFETTRSGKHKSGRGGTTRYFGLRH